MLLSQMLFPVSGLRTYPLKTGPFVDSIKFSVIEGDEQQVQALVDNDVDVIKDFVDPAFLGLLEQSENIIVEESLRNGYGYICINTAKYPYNITDFRRACAFVLNKTYISEAVWSGHSKPQDSCVPQINPFSSEGLLDYNYYNENEDKGNELLDRAGFEINPITEYRMKPNGDPLNIIIQTAQSSNIAIETSNIFAEALQKIHLNATSVPTDYYEYSNKLYYHYDYDMVFLGTSFGSIDVDWLALEYWSEYDDEPYYNAPNWRNATYDSWRDQLIHSIDYEEVYQAAFEMQRIWVHSCPVIVCYENALLNAYRTDRYEGFVNDIFEGVPGWWTQYRAHLKDGQTGAPWGSELRFTNPLDFGTFNFMVSSCYCDRFADEMYDFLFRYSSEGLVVPWLAKSYVINTHQDDSSVPQGHTRFDFNLIRNASWTDGTPLTAYDVAYTLSYYNDAPGNPYGPDLEEMTAAYALTDFRLRVEFNSESYWHISKLTSKPIIPKHIFIDIGLEGWNTWNPHPPEDEIVTSGPWVVSEYESGSHVTLSWNENYFYSADRSFIPSTTSSTMTNPGTSHEPQTLTSISSTDSTVTSSPTVNLENDWIGMFFSTIGITVTIGSVVVIIILGARIAHERRKK